MVVASPKPRKKVMILCAGDAKSMRLGLSDFKLSSKFWRQVERIISELPESVKLTWIGREVESFNGCSIMSPEYWLVLRECIVKSVDVEGCSGILVLHDLATLTYSSAAMSFLLYGLPAAVVFTGLMKNIELAERDVWENLTGGLMLFEKGVADGVHLYFHGDILKPLRSIMIKTSGRHPFVESDAAYQYDVPFLPKGISYNSLMKAVSIGVLPLFPGLDSSFLDSMLGSGVHALVLEHDGAELAVGEGFAGGLVESLRNAHVRGIVVVAISKCSGRDIHKLSAEIRAAGVISGGYITREAMLGKLYALLGVELKQNQIREFIEG